MNAQSNKKKSAHLQELEEVFDQHTRRFSLFAVLELTPNEEETAEPPDDAESASSPTIPPPGSDIPPLGLLTPLPGPKDPRRRRTRNTPPPLGLIDPYTRRTPQALPPWV
jgi:hypothetical protein